MLSPKERVLLSLLRSESHPRKTLRRETRRCPSSFATLLRTPYRAGFNPGNTSASLRRPSRPKSLKTSRFLTISSALPPL